MKKILLVSIYCFINTILYSQNQAFGWAFQNTTEIKQIQTDQLGNVYITGTFTGTRDFDPGVGVFNLTPPSSSSSSYIVKLSSSGTFIWAKGITGFSCQSHSMVIDQMGNLYLAGVFSNQLSVLTDFDPGLGVYNVPSVQNSASFLLKLDNNGDFIWVKTFDFLFSIYTKIDMDSNNNIYIANTFNGTIDVNPDAGVYSLISAGSDDVFVLKLDNAGNFMWAKQIGGTQQEYFSAITIDPSDNVYLAGIFQGTCDFDPSANLMNLTTSKDEPFVLKLNMNGDYVSVKSFTCSAISNLGNNVGADISSIKTDSIGNLYIGGYFDSTVDFDPNSGISNLQAFGSNTYWAGYTDSYILKLDSSGNFKWVKQFGMMNPSQDDLYDISIDKTGNIYASGIFDGTTDLDPGSGVYNFTSPSTGVSMFIVNLDSSGNFKWGKCVQALSNMGVYGKFITCDKNFGVYIAGSFEALFSTPNGNVDFNPDSGIYNLNYNNMNQGFVLKLEPCLLGAPAPPVNTTPSNSQTICPNTKAVLSASCVVGTPIWYSSITSTTVLAAGASYTTPTLSTGTYTYYVEAYTCTVSASRTPIIIDVLSIPSITATSSSSLVCIGQSATLNALGATSYTWNTGANTNSITVSPTSNITYTVRGATMGNCISAKTISLSVKPLPVINIVGTNTICNESAGTFTLNNAVSYTCASVPSNTVIGNKLFTMPMPFGIGVYTITGTSSFGCVGLATTFTVYSKPTPTVTINSGTLCAGNSFTLMPTGANTYYYSSGNSVISPLATSDYSVYGTAVNGCTNVAVSTVSVIPTPTIVVNSGVICSGQSFTIVPMGGSSYTFNSGSSVVTPISTSNYTVWGTDTNGCIGNAISSVTINPLPNIVVNSGSVCLGTSFTMNPSGALTYTYNNGSSIVTPTTTTSFTITGTDLNGCIDTVAMTVTVHQLSTINITGNTTLCGNSSTELYSTGANTYTWNTGITSNSIVVSPSVTSTYTVVGTNSVNCSSSQTIEVAVDNTCQSVWPGDANSDGIADNLDVLELGLHYTQTGAARTTTSNAWQAYTATNWAGTISNGKNMNHSDCNGDGIINTDDTLAIYNNYGLTHTFKLSNIQSTNPVLNIVPDQNLVNTGTWGTSSVYLGDATNPMSNVNGLAFTLNYDKTLIETDSIYLEYSNSFINSGQNLHFRKNVFTNSVLHTATTHTNNVNTSGYGKIATLHYKIKPTLTANATLNISATQAFLANASGSISPITSGTASLTAIALTTQLNHFANGNLIYVYPNPTSSELYIETNTPIENATVKLTNALGQVVLTETINSKQQQLTTSGLAKGIYLLELWQGNNILFRNKLVKE